MAPYLNVNSREFKNSIQINVMNLIDHFWCELSFTTFNYLLVSREKFRGRLD